MEERYAMIGILVIVVVSVFAVMYVDSATGALSGSSFGGYTAGPKIYGGMTKKVYQQPNVMGRAFERQLYIDRAQQFLYANQDKWDCSFGKEAETSPYPCVADENNPGKYCCVIPEDLPNRYAQWAT
jgi:hypothetical protein